jgi:hypothetical protein
MSIPESVQDDFPFPVDEEVMNALSALANAVRLDKVKRAACVVAEIFGADGAFPALLDETAGKVDEKKLVSSFQGNLQLLVQKTWVDQSDEALKALVLVRLERFCARIGAGNYADAYCDFREILSDTVYLLFGEQTKQDDFTEYAWHIDPSFGIFWRYVQNLPTEEDMRSVKKCRLLLLLGMEFLAHY